MIDWMSIKDEYQHTVNMTDHDDDGFTPLILSR